MFNGYNHRVARGDLSWRDQNVLFCASEVRLQILLRTKENISVY